jgi:hypothetical protein
MDRGVKNKTPPSVGHHGVSTKIDALQKMKKTPPEIWECTKNCWYGGVTNRSASLSCCSGVT